MFVAVPRQLDSLSQGLQWRSTALLSGPEVSPPLPMLMGSRRSFGLKEASEWCQKHSREGASPREGQE